MSQYPDNSGDSIYQAIRDAIETDTDLHEAYDPTDVISGGTSHINGGFIVDISRRSQHTIQASDSDYYIWDIKVRFIRKRLGNINTDSGEVRNDKSEMLRYDRAIESAFHRALDLQGYETDIQILDARYLTSSTVKKLPDSGDFLIQELSFSVEGTAQKLIGRL